MARGKEFGATQRSPKKARDRAEQREAADAVPLGRGRRADAGAPGRRAGARSRHRGAPPPARRPGGSLPPPRRGAPPPSAAQSPKRRRDLGRAPGSSDGALSPHPAAPPPPAHGAMARDESPSKRRLVNATTTSSSSSSGGGGSSSSSNGGSSSSSSSDSSSCNNMAADLGLITKAMVKHVELINRRRHKRVVAFAAVVHCPIDGCKFFALMLPEYQRMNAFRTHFEKDHPVQTYECTIFPCQYKGTDPLHPCP